MLTAASGSPMKALELLIEGNQRFFNHLRLLETFATRLGLERLAKQGQNPFCAVLTCSDARIPVEAVFDRGFGEIFVARTFGSVVDEAVIGSLEYGVEHLNIGLLVIMGHTGCSSVRLSHELIQGKHKTSHDPAHLHLVADQVGAAIRATEKRLNKKLSNRKSDSALFETEVEFIRQRVQQIHKFSSVIQKKIANNKLLLIGAIFDLDSGRVEFDLPDLEKRSLTK